MADLFYCPEINGLWYNKSGGILNNIYERSQTA